MARASFLRGPEILEPRLLLDGSMYLGTNLDGVADWGAVAFVDVFNEARTWQTRNIDGSGSWNSGLGNLVPVDADGWPLEVPFDPETGDPVQIVHTVIPMRGTGTYLLKAEGTGTIKFKANNGHLDPTTSNTRSVTFQLTGGSEEIDLEIYDTQWGDGIGALFMEVLSSDMNDPVRNLDLVLPDHEDTYQTEPFLSTYTDDLSPLVNLRFMDWGKTNGNPLVTWSDRTTPDSYTQTRSQGVSLEYIIMMANQQQQDAWFCVPHMADDTYVQNLAKTILYGSDGQDPYDSPQADPVYAPLDPNLKVFVEYSNETWNGMFSQTTYVQNQGEALGLDPARWTAGQMYVSLRSAEIWQAFEDEFGAEPSDRLIKVMPTQAASTNISNARRLKSTPPVPVRH